MKPNNSNPSLKYLMGVSIISFFSCITFSCKKDASQVTLPGNKMDEAATILGGKKLSGNLISSQNETELSLNINNGQSYILLEKIPGNDLAVIPAKRLVEIITSDFGIVINDPANHKTLLFANNDQASLMKLEKVKSLLDNSEISKVFGTTTINAAN